MKNRDESQCIQGEAVPEQMNNSAIKVAKSVRETVDQDGAVLLDIDQGLCFSLNPVGARIWEMIKNGHPLDEIADALERDFHVPRTQLLTDISDFVKQLESMRLVGEQCPDAERRGILARLLNRLRSPFVTRR